MRRGRYRIVAHSRVTRVWSAACGQLPGRLGTTRFMPNEAAFLAPATQPAPRRDVRRYLLSLRGDSLTIDHGWREIADEALSWLSQRLT